MNKTVCFSKVLFITLLGVSLLCLCFAQAQMEEEPIDADFSSSSSTVPSNEEAIASSNTPPEGIFSCENGQLNTELSNALGVFGTGLAGLSLRGFSSEAESLALALGIELRKNSNIWGQQVPFLESCREYTGQSVSYFELTPDLVFNAGQNAPFVLDKSILTVVGNFTQLPIAEKSFCKDVSLSTDTSIEECESQRVEAGQPANFMGVNFDELINNYVFSAGLSTGTNLSILNVLAEVGYQPHYYGSSAFWLGFPGNGGQLEKAALKVGAYAQLGYSFALTNNTDNTDDANESDGFVARVKLGGDIEFPILSPTDSVFGSFSLSLPFESWLIYDVVSNEFHSSLTGALEIGVDDRIIQDFKFEYDSGIEGEESFEVSTGLKFLLP